MCLGSPLLESEEVLDGACEGCEDMGLEGRKVDDGFIGGRLGEPEIVYCNPLDGSLDGGLPVKYAYLDAVLLSDLPHAQSVKHYVRSRVGASGRALS